MRKVVRVLILILIIVAALSGCKLKDNKEKETGKADESDLPKGRYVEKDVELPLGLDYIDIISLAVSPEGTIELYTTNKDFLYEKYIYKDNAWIKDDCTALQNVKDFMM